MIKSAFRHFSLIAMLGIINWVLCSSCTSAMPDTIPTTKVMKFIGTNIQGYKEYRHIMTGMIFVLIPGGVFKMGSDHGDRDEQPVHEVCLNSFLIGKYEVTQSVWQKIMGDNPSHFKEAKQSPANSVPPDSGSDDYPVEMVLWDDCNIFCMKTGLRLPTEAEWEYACRAGANTRFYWGDEENGQFLWYKNNSMGTTQPVGRKKPNGFGLHDMLGNAWEWCYDWYGEDYYRYFPGQAKNPIGPLDGPYHIVRGGGWFNEIKNCRSTDRDGPGPDGYCRGNGFRCATNLD
jgi:formylglycine-generating enzyme required for sulfatase activity